MSRPGLYEHRRSLGKCWGCGDMARPGKAHCEACAKRATARVTSRYHERKARGVCVVCEVETPGIRCDDCVRAQNARRREREAERIASGRCAKCPNPLSSRSKRYCDSHLDDLRERGRRVRDRKSGRRAAKRTKCVERRAPARTASPRDGGERIQSPGDFDPELDRLDELLDLSWMFFDHKWSPAA